MTEKVDRELRYSASHDGWFWRVRVANPYPMLMPDGKPNLIDRYIYESGFCYLRKSAERTMNRAERRVLRRIGKARKEYG